MAAGIDNLIKCDDFAKEQVQETIKAGGGGVDSSEIKWRVGELEFEAWMRLLDSMVRRNASLRVDFTVEPLHNGHLKDRRK